MGMLLSPQPTIENFEQSLMLFSRIVDNDQPSIDEIFRYRLDIVLAEGLQFK
ncbi:unnamed protein product, partial [Thelazia callipaeda]|uniref:Transcriptional regulator n=1 Tax=Thelazia callipaeda TaxID=103827 RepID=A0A0N5CTD1_THECL